MDPLSVTASAITLLHAANYCVKKIDAISHAPQELRLLGEEASDLHDLLQQVKADSPTQTGHGDVDVDVESAGGISDGLNRQLSRISVKLKELERLVKEYSPRGLPNRFGANRSYWGWSRGRQRAEKLRAELHTLRLNLTASLAAVNTKLGTCTL